MFQKFCYLLLIFSITLSAQEIDRVELLGNIVVPEGDDPEGITVFNESTSRGTISNEFGAFQIVAGDGDRIVFSSVQFEQFSIYVTDEIAAAGVLNVSVHIAINKLPEVTVSSGNLTGSINVDVNRIKVTAAQLPSLEQQVINTPRIETPESYPVRNQAQLSGQTYMVNGLNIKNIVKLISGAFSKNDGDSYRELPYQELDNEVKKLYSSDFFKETLELDSTQVNEFIFYAADNGLDGKMLAEKNELQIIQFLIEQRKNYQSHLTKETPNLDK